MVSGITRSTSGGESWKGEKGEAMGATKIERLTEQRNRAWRVLATIEDQLSQLISDSEDIPGIALLLADSHGSSDEEEWNAVTRKGKS